MDLRALETFVAVADLGGFRAAADRLHRSQSAVSTHVRRLEEELGVPLFDRTTRRVSLTDDGRLLLERCRIVIADLRSVARELSERSELRHGHVSIGTVPSISAHRLPDTCAQFRREHPGITLELHEGSAGRVYADLNERVTDFAIGPRLAGMDQFEHEPVTEDPFVVVLPPGVVAPRAGLTLRQLARHDQVSQLADTAVRATVEQLFSEHSLDFRPKIEVAHHQTVLAMVAAGLGASLIPALCVPEWRQPAIQVVPLRSPRLVREICIITTKGKRLSPAAERCATLLAGALRA